MKADLTHENIAKAEELFSSNMNFVYTVLPRMKLLYSIKKKLKDYHDLNWSFEFDHVNMNQNRVIIEYLPSVSTELDLYYEIPLVKKFELRSFLGNSSVHFIDVYNFLLEDDYVKENQFVIRAEYRKIPHFILNLNVKRYQTHVLKLYSQLKQNSINKVDELVFEEIKSNFNLFNPIFKIIINNFRF